MHLLVHCTKLYYQQLHLKYWCNLARYWSQAVWGWQDSVETCSSVIICEIIVCICWLIVQNCITNSCIWNTGVTWQRYWLQAVWGWHDSVETCRSCNNLWNNCVHLLVTVQNDNRCTVHHHHHHHHHISVMELGHLLTRSRLTYTEVSSKVCHDSFCQLENSVSLPWVIYHGAFYLHVVSSFSCILWHLSFTFKS